MNVMKYFRVHALILFVALAVLPAVVLFDVRTSRGQSQGSSKAANGDAAESRLKPTVLIRSRGAEDKEIAPASSAFGTAAMHNALLRSELNWMFGGKQQRGWYLYLPLIHRLLDTEEDASSPSFAAALARWQQKSGLPSSGELNEESLYAMISEWQGKRLKEREYPPSERLMIAPVDDFYDPLRLDELRQVERETYAAYKRMVAAAIADTSLELSVKDGALSKDEKYLKIMSSFRTREYQEQLRRASPGAGRAGLAINSPHFTGRALDLYVGGEPVNTNDSNRAVQVQTPVYQWLVRNADRFGFCPYYYEPWHWEYVK
jgi:zinc D-Ala-D-Ala carboxypeptidase